MDKPWTLVEFGGEQFVEYTAAAAVQYGERLQGEIEKDLGVALDTEKEFRLDHGGWRVAVR